jgi:hypothetical protein
LCQYRLGAGNIAAEVFVVDCAWTSADGLVYANSQNTAAFGSPTPVSSVTGLTVTNSGLETGTAGRAVEVRITAATSTSSPWVRFDHPDGTWERVTFQGLTLGVGQTLTIAGDRVPRVGSQIVSGYIRSTTQAGGPSRAARWWTPRRWPPPCAAAGFKGSLQRGTDRPDGGVVEIEAVGIAGLEGFEEQVPLCDVHQQGIAGGVGISGLAAGHGSSSGWRALR